MTPQLPEKQNKKPAKNILKDKRSFWLSHEAFLYLQALAEQEGVQTPQYLEMISRQLAREHLPEEERSRIQAEAKRIAETRRQAARAGKQTDPGV